MKNFLKNYGFILSMLLGIAGGCIVGLVNPQLAGNLEPLGTLFTNMMFCVVVPMVRPSDASMRRSSSICVRAVYPLRMQRCSR